MPISSDTARTLTKELERLKEERTQLDQVISGLEKTLSAGGVKKRAPRAQAASTGKRKPGKRQEQALSLIEKEPGITPSALAEQMGIQGPAIYPVLKSLTQNGLVEKDGKGYKMLANGAKEEKKAPEKKEEKAEEKSE